ncbi:hypothetical protein [Priestia aryabhattai]|uniref:hypothetical protein n=1 Tax=Priestia aryabhattai TaxID=412384 RepID=UPI00187580D1|nr:hypothetical protein [Priestia aryabhattai]MBE5102240.1 hypothetical protein [Priestia aryabhattai]
MNYKKILDNFDVSAQGIWYPIGLGIVLLVFILFMPKKLTWKEIYITFGIVGWLATITDLIVGANLDFYNLGKPQHEGVGDIISYGFIPPLFAIIYLNYYKKGKRWRFVLLFTILSLLAHWLMIQVGFMKKNIWKVGYDIPVFLFVYRCFLPWHIRFIRKN